MTAPRRRSILREVLRAAATLAAAAGLAFGVWGITVLVLLAGQS